MSSFDKEVFLQIANNTGVFNPPEIEIFKELLDEYEEYPEEDYFLYQEKRDVSVVGFVFFTRTLITEFSWDIYWLMVDKTCQGQGIGKRLLTAVEEHVLALQQKAIIRVETSTKKEYAHARNLYERIGYKESGRIPNFYAIGDDLITLYKEIAR